MNDAITAHTPGTTRGPRKRFLNQVGPVYFALLLLMIIGLATQHEVFFTLRNWRNIVISTTPWAMATLGQALVLLTAGIDLSIGATISISNTIAAFLMQQYPERVFEIVLLCIATGILIGSINGFAIAYLRLNPFILTLATGIFIQGISLSIMYQPGGLVTDAFRRVATISLGPVPYALFYVLILYLAVQYILKRTPLGLSIYAVGGNETSARLAGINTQQVLLFVYSVSGFLAALAGLFLASRIGSGDPIVGDPASLDSITAAVLGGTSLFGGIGNLWGGLAGALFLGVLSTTLNLNNISPFYQWIVKGLILIVALAIDLWRKGGKR